nr:MAG TPA: 4Fe-4S binding domain protein [Caudoviricetes sp.]
MTNWSIGDTLSLATNIDFHQLYLSGWCGFLCPIHNVYFTK